MKFLVLLLSFFAFSCVNTAPPPTPSPQPAAVIKKDTVTWHCVPIAPLPSLQRAVGMKGRFWQTGQTIKVGFIGGSVAQRDLVKAALAEWAKYANLKFEYPTSGMTNVRVSFNPGSAYSYIGVDCNAVPQSKETMNIGFGGLEVALHECGHFVGLAHEHQSPNQRLCFNEPVVLKDLGGSPNFWSADQVHFNVLDVIPPENVITTPLDGSSIMLYSMPGRWMCNGIALVGGTRLSANDKSFIAKQYPYPVAPPKAIQLTPAQVDSILNIMATRQAKYQQFLTEAQSDYSTVKKMLGR